VIHRPGIAVHGGAGTISPSALTPELERRYRAALAAATGAGMSILAEDGCALAAVAAAVVVLEDEPLFNAGKGAVFTHEGIHELDAALMEGTHLRVGAVAQVRGIANPILLARAVMEQGEHVLLAGAGAEAFARHTGFAQLPDDYFFTEERFVQLKAALASGTTQLDHSPAPSIGTVGAVACDRHGHLAAATSTGGMTNKRFGRLGDTPIPGAGTYADDATCAVSCTGHGEYFLRYVAAYDVGARMKYAGQSLTEAADAVVLGVLRQAGGEGGLIAINSRGEIAMPFNSVGMYRAWQSVYGRVMTAIFEDAIALP
jgi:L-asparaginase / beta-aspartyl-peptidase